MTQKSEAKREREAEREEHIVCVVMKVARRRRRQIVRISIFTLTSGPLADHSIMSVLRHCEARASYTLYALYDYYVIRETHCCGGEHKARAELRTSASIRMKACEKALNQRTKTASTVSGRKMGPSFWWICVRGADFSLQERERGRELYMHLHRMFVTLASKAFVSSSIA